MAHDDTTPQFPYQHLAVLGMEKLKKYVPPAEGSAERSSAPRLDASTNGATSGNGRK